MNPNDPNVALVEMVARRLGDLGERFVFVGGCAAGLLITDDARPPVRATRDVDLIVELASLVSYYDLNDTLRRLGLREDPDLTCRWSLEGVKVDVMPTEDVGQGFTNRWYPRAAQRSSRVSLPGGMQIRLVSAPLFVATKLEAFYGRGAGDYGASHDIEDIVAVVDGRPELAVEVAGSESDVREYIESEVDSLLADGQFVETLSWHFAGDAESQARIPEVIRRLRLLAGI
jgi:predicted nucleotidyltransferase